MSILFSSFFSSKLILFHRLQTGPLELIQSGLLDDIKVRFASF